MIPDPSQSNSEPAATFEAVLTTSIHDPAISGRLSAQDPNGSDLAFYTLLSSTSAGFTLQEDGRWTFEPSSVSNLQRGERKTLNFYYQVDDHIAWLPPQLPPGTILVGGPNGQYKSIQDAIDRSAAGSILYIAPGVYNGDLLITKEITLLGAFNGVPGIDISRGKTNTESIIRGFIEVSATTKKIAFDGLTFVALSDNAKRGVNMRIQAESVRIANSIITSTSPNGGFADFAFVKIIRDNAPSTPYSDVNIENNLFQGIVSHRSRPVPLQINHADFARVEGNTFLETGGGANICLAGDFKEAIVKKNLTIGGGKGLATFNGVFNKLFVLDNTFLESNLNGLELNTGSDIRAGLISGNLIHGSGIDIFNSKYTDIFANILVYPNTTLSQNFQIRDNDLSRVQPNALPYRGFTPLGSTT